MEARKLFRSNRDRVLAGVAAGIAEYFNIDPVIIRVIFIATTIFGGTGALVYLLLAIALPVDEYR